MFIVPVYTVLSTVTVVFCNYGGETGTGRTFNQKVRPVVAELYSNSNLSRFVLMKLSHCYHLLDYSKNHQVNNKSAALFGMEKS